MKAFSLFTLIPLTLFSLGFCHAYDDSEWHLSADVLMWTVKEAGADNWAEEITTDGILLPSRVNHLKEVNFPWDPGLRIAASYQPCYSDWNSCFSYTRFNTQGSDNVRGTPGTVHSTFLGNFYVNNPDGFGISGPAYQNAGIKWKIDFNILDWDVGYNLCLSKAVQIRPFIGLKGGWIHQSIYSTWENPDIIIDYFNLGTENIQNNFWGIGLQAGANFKWNPFFNSCSGFYFFGDFSGAMLYGHWSFSDQFTKDTGEQIIVRLEDVNNSSTMIRSFMGCAWDCFRNDQWSFSVRLGFEVQVWLNQLKYYSFTGGRLRNQLSLQGGTVEFNFGF